jgi:hypothetical protein
MANNSTKPPDCHLVRGNASNQSHQLHKVWDFHKYGLYWCGTRNLIMQATNLQKSLEFPITDINHGCIYLWESMTVRKRFELCKILQEGGCGTLTECIRHIERWDNDIKLWKLEDKRMCYLKKPLPPTKSFRDEAVLQIMARDVLERRGFIGAVPEVYDIFKLPSGDEVFTMEYKEGCIIVHDYVRFNPKFIKSDRSIATFFFQVAYYLYCLDETYHKYYSKFKRYSSSIFKKIKYILWYRQSRC